MELVFNQTAILSYPLDMAETAKGTITQIEQLIPDFSSHASLTMQLHTLTKFGGQKEHFSKINANVKCTQILWKRQVRILCDCVIKELNITKSVMERVGG